MLICSGFSDFFSSEGDWFGSAGSISCAGRAVGRSLGGEVKLGSQLLVSMTP